MAASLQDRAFYVMVMALALSFLLAVHVEACPPPEGPIEKKMGSISIQDQLNVILNVQCDFDFRHEDVGTILVTGYNGFEFPIVDQNYWKCTLSAPAIPSWPTLSGMFTSWVRNPSFSPGNFVYWMVNKDGLYMLPNKNMRITPQDGKLVYHWSQ